MAAATGFCHLEPVMGTVVGIRSPDPLPAAAVEAAVAVLHDADRLFSLWKPDSPMSRLRAGQAAVEDFGPCDAATIRSVLARCAVARQVTGGAFDPWSLPGGVDPTGLVKGWAVERARDAIVARGHDTVMVNGGGDIAVAGVPPGGPWRAGIRHPMQPTQLAAVVEVGAGIATSGNYERPGELIDPATGRTARGVISATVVGPELDLADALATALAVRGAAMLEVIAALPGYGAYMIADDGRQYAGGAVPFVSP
ncbi:MAG TPA: FAD:protein FMN transferase [Acidimicrobiales bacterium]|nr:FAD:protein FMN transferase [Acidimicrobiales bacterium]